MPRLSAILLGVSLLVSSVFGQATATVPGPKDARIEGELAAEGDAFLVKSAVAHLVFGGADSTNYRFTARIKFDPTKANSVGIRVIPDAPMDYTKPNKGYLSLHAPDKAIYITATSSGFDDKGKAITRATTNLYYAPYGATPELAAAAAKKLTDAGGTVGTWQDRWVPVRVDVTPASIQLWVEGLLLDEVKLKAGEHGPTVLDAYAGARIRDAKIEPLDPEGVLIPIDLTYLTNDKWAQPLGMDRATVGGVPFEFPLGASNLLSLRKASWVEWKEDPQDYYEWYDNGPPVLRDPRMPFLKIPNEDYAAVHVLAVADGDPATLPVVTMRAGKYGWSTQTARTDFMATVPRAGEVSKVSKRDLLDTPAGKLVHVRIPWTDAFAQDIEGPIDLEITKQVRLAVHAPDPNRFRNRPLGLPSGVRIAAITLERSPLQMKVTSKESAHAFVEPLTPSFDITLTNVTDKAQAYEVRLDATHYHGEKASAEVSGKVPAGGTKTIALPIKAPLRGYYDAAFTLRDGEGETLLIRRTSFAVLPPDTRTYRKEMPWGIWDFGVGHFTNPDADRSASLQRKIGMNYTGTINAEARKKYGLTLGNEPNIAGGPGVDVKVYEAVLKANPDMLRQVLIFHETAVSYENVLKPPDIFVDWPAYSFNDAEKKQFQMIWDSAIAAGKAIRADHSDTKISLGNGPVPTAEEMLRAKFPKEYFDYLGNEAPNFGRPPESQPPDCVANVSSFWMDRQLLDHYGYGEKPIQHCYEASYIATNPGNMSLHDQADNYIRLFLHSLAWDIPYQRYGCANDMGNSYYYSNWGATGFCGRYPEVAPKPSYVAVGTMTRVLDGAEFARDVETGSASVYVLEFDRRDGSRVWAVWTPRGRRPVIFQFEPNPVLTLVDDQSNESRLKTSKDRAEVTLSPTPVYVTGKGTLKSVTLGEPEYADAPPAKHVRIASLRSMEDWTVDKARDADLEFYTLLQPRRKGDFEFVAVSNSAIKVTPRPITTGEATMPMYGAIIAKRPIPVPVLPGGGVPTEVGVWVNGNSSSGRVIFEFEDASGQAWTSIGASSVDAPPYWMAKVVPADVKGKHKATLSDWNTNDVFGRSWINFDGWRYVSFPMPGQYPGEGYHWPSNGQWRSNKDGIVHYPLKFTRLIFELPEKTLHIKTYEPVKRPEIYVKNLTVGYGEADGLKAPGRD